MKTTRQIKKLTQHIRTNLTVCAASVFFTQLVFSPLIQAAPTGGNIGGGSGNINQSGSITTITQGSQRLAIDWATFNVNQHETVNFNQPSQSAIALNRIHDLEPSRINGAINANGRLIFSNPNGMIFGENATVNAAGLFITTLKATDPTEFVNTGQLNLEAVEGATGLIVNKGRLAVLDYGALILLGQQIRNENLLIARFGTIALAAGSNVTVQFSDSDINIQINENRLAEILHLDDPQIINTGLIQAHGGNVILTTSQASQIKTSVFKRDESHAFSFTRGTIVERNGEIFLAGPGGDISNTGEVDVSSETDAGTVVFDARNINHSGTIYADSYTRGNGGKVLISSTDTTLLTDNSLVSAQSHENGNGGTVHVLGNHVGLTDHAEINASGANDGGEVLVGGDFQGKNTEIKNAEAVYLGEDTHIIADATKKGEGGKIIVWSDDRTRAYGSLSAKGAGDGRGGFIETSSHNYVDLFTSVDVSAESGQHGEWLIDPSNLTISGSNNGTTPDPTTPFIYASTINSSFLDVGTLEAALGNGANITVQTAIIPGTCTTAGCVPPPDSQLNGGDITLASALNLDDFPDNGATSLTLNAHRHININATISEGGTATGDDYLNLTLNADSQNSNGVGDVNINADINLDGGNLFISGNNLFNNASITTANITNPVDAPGGDATINVNAAANLGNLSTDSESGNLIVVAGSINGGVLNIAGTSTFTSGGVVNLNNTGNDFGGAVTVNNGTTITLTDSNTLTLGDIDSSSLTATATDISQVATTALNITGASRFTASNDVTLTQNNNLGSNIRLNANNATIVHTGAVNLGASTIGANLDITSGGSITDSGTINVTGTSTFRAPAGSNIILDFADNQFNGTVNFLINGTPGNLNNITLRDTSGFTLQNNLNINGDLNLRAANLTLNDFTLGSSSTLTLAADSGNIDQNIAINHAGTTILTATNGDINFSLENNLASVQINSANTATINNGTNSIDIADVNNTGNLDVDAGSITQSGNITVTTLVDLDASAGSASIGNINAGTLNVNANGIVLGSNNSLNITDTATLDAGASAIIMSFLNSSINAANLDITAADGISGINTRVTVSGVTTLNSGASDTRFNHSQNDFADVNITNADDVSLSDINSINISGNMASLNIIAGRDNSISNISNVTDTVLNVTGASTFVLQNGGDISLANFSGIERNNLQGLISITTTTGTLNTVDILNTADIQLATLDNVSTRLNLNTLANITQNAAFTVNGITDLQANSITLLQNNNFVGDVTIIDSNTVQLNDTSGGINIIARNTNASNTIDLNLTSTSNVGISGELLNMAISTSAGDIQSTGTLLVANNTTLNAGATGNVDFQTNQVNLENLSITLANDVLINEVDSLIITDATVNNLMDIDAAGAVSVNGSINTLDINTGNTVSLSGQVTDLTVLTSAGGIQNGADALNVTGTTILEANASDINLNHAANDFNTLAISSAQDVTLRDVNAITLLDINTRDFTLTTGGNITQAAGTLITSTRDAIIDSGNASITLTENNMFTSLGLSAALANVINDQALTLNDSNLTDSLNLTTNNGNLSINRITAISNINLTAADSILDTNGDTANLIANKATLRAANGIGMGSSINTQLVNLAALNTGNGDINISNSGGDITLDAITNMATDTGNFNFESTNDVFINNITLQQNLVENFFPSGTGTVSMFTADGSFLGVGIEDINNPDITATNLRLVGVKGTLGTIQRPVVLDISGKVELLMRASLDPVYVPPAPAANDIQDNSIFQFTSGSILSAANGVQVTEVETLLDIDPAIFTQIRHFVAESEPLMLPRDQWFDDGYTEEDDDEYFNRIEDKNSDE